MVSNRVAAVDESDEDMTKNDTSAQGDALTMGVVPPPSQHLKASFGEKVLKLCGESEWQPRNIIITFDAFMITHPGASDISDQIPMVRFARNR